MRFDEGAQGVGRDEKIPPAEETEKRPPRDRKHVLPAQAAPDRFEFAHARRRGVSRIIGAVERADARAEDHVGDDPVRGERVEHADLNGAETPAARENEGCLGLVARHGSIIEHDPEKWAPVFGKDHAPT